LVSKNALSGIRIFPVKDESSGQWAPQFAQTGKSALHASVAADLKGAVAHDPNLDLIAFFKAQRVDYSVRNPHGQAISPFGDLHLELL
jgi:hypothetical protein